jgi:hypothetical protein
MRGVLEDGEGTAYARVLWDSESLFLSLFDPHFAAREGIQGYLAHKETPP